MEDDERSKREYNVELNKLVEKKPKSLEELTGIIDPIKLKVHGNLIVEIIMVSLTRARAHLNFFVSISLFPHYFFVCCYKIAIYRSEEIVTK